MGPPGFYVRSTLGVIARIDASLAYVADALKAFGDPDDLDTRRVKAMVLLCNPTEAVELLAAFTGLKSQRLGQGVQAADPELSFDEPAGEPDDRAGTDQPDDALDRMEAFARRVGFRPTHLPAWLAVHTSELKPFGFDWSALLPTLTMNIHLSYEDLVRGAGGVARWEGECPVTHQFVHEHLRPVHRYRVQPVIDLAHQAPVDAYEIPDRHRRAVRLRTPADCFPYSSDTSGRGDLDHTLAHRPAPAGAGEKALLSCLENYGPLGRFHHRIKTHGRWVVRQPFGGIYLWRDPHGQIYLTDHTGSHKVTPAGHTAGPARHHDTDLELYPADEIIHADFGPTS